MSEEQETAIRDLPEIERDADESIDAAVEQARLTLREENRVGRPTVLSDSLTSAICEWIERGNYLETACKGVGVNRTMLYRWLETANDQSLSDEQRRPFEIFRDRIERAQARAETSAVEALLLTGKTDPRSWGALTWYLERRNRALWGRQDRLEIEGKMSLTDLITASLRESEEQRESDETRALEESERLDEIEETSSARDDRDETIE
jgi:transposase-like protein